MTTTNTGGPAFPQSREFGDFFTGMTLRDYFAAKAMQGLLSNVEADDIATHRLTLVCYHIADEMLKARNDRQTDS